MFKHYYDPSSYEDIIKARTENPEGTYCKRCGRENDLADDCGWFFF